MGRLWRPHIAACLFFNPFGNCFCSMKFDHTWEAVVRPGMSNRFFQFEGSTEIERPKFHSRVAGYSPVNAWWLSEISRLIYVRDADEDGGIDDGRSRSGFLAPVNLREYCFIDKTGIQCAVIVSCDTVEAPFAVLVFRGTSAFETWLSNLNTLQAGWDAGGLVHAGFKNEFYKIWDELNGRLSEIPPDVPVFYTGHSLGGALATLAASRRSPAAVYTFGSPKVGDTAFALSLREVPVFRVVNNRDLVALLPPSRIPFDFCHVGETCHYPGGMGPETVPSMTIDASLSEERHGGWGSRAAFFKRSLMAPPEFLSDHAPINYSLRLQKEIMSFNPNVNGSVEQAAGKWRAGPSIVRF